VSSGAGFLVLFGASVQTGVILVEYINQISGAYFDWRRRSRRSYAEAQAVIVGGLIVELIISIFLLPTFHVWWARPYRSSSAPPS